MSQRRLSCPNNTNLPLQKPTSPSRSGRYDEVFRGRLFTNYSKPYKNSNPIEPHQASSKPTFLFRTSSNALKSAEEKEKGLVTKGSAKLTDKERPTRLLKSLLWKTRAQDGSQEIEQNVYACKEFIIGFPILQSKRCFLTPFLKAFETKSLYYNYLLVAGFLVTWGTVHDLQK